jgi:hypothetical protein
MKKAINWKAMLELGSVYLMDRNQRCYAHNAATIATTASIVVVFISVNDFLDGYYIKIL